MTSKFDIKSALEHLRNIACEPEDFEAIALIETELKRPIVDCTDCGSCAVECESCKSIRIQCVKCGRLMAGRV